jgi:tRNA modification GTPase
MRSNLTDTIAAIATPPGEGGISVIRISGERSFGVIEEVFSSTKDKFTPVKANDFNSHTVHFGYIFDQDDLLDEILVTIFKQPGTYTGEDVIEISSHGGTFVVSRILALLFKKGARHAEPGEFTKRAFLNGRMDLSQAEAVADLIHAKTESAHTASIKQLEGSLSHYVAKVKEDILNATSLVELELDFAEEDLEFVHKKDLKERILNTISDLEKIIASYITGRVIREGAKLVIAGNPNAGKSSLFNHLLRTNRAIVSEIAGTTRDYIEENLIIDGVLFNLVDTAGLRMSNDSVESEGIKRSYERIKEADLILFLIDSSEGIESIKKNIQYFEQTFDRAKSILVFSKTDLNKNTITQDAVSISILDDGSIDALKKEMVRKVLSKEGAVSSGEIILTNIRHKTCLENTVSSLKNAIQTLDENMSGEYISVDLRNALSHLGEITGEVTNQDILNHIFSKFCIGK